jgi:hypothetical protein
MDKTLKRSYKTAKSKQYDKSKQCFFKTLNLNTISIPFITLQQQSFIVPSKKSVLRSPT